MGILLKDKVPFLLLQETETSLEPLDVLIPAGILGIDVLGPAALVAVEELGMSLPGYPVDGAGEELIKHLRLPIPAHIPDSRSLHLDLYQILLLLGPDNEVLMLRRYAPLSVRVQLKVAPSQGLVLTGGVQT